MIAEHRPTQDRRRWAALAVLIGAVGLLTIDATVLALAVPALSRDLGATATQVLWIGDVYSFALAGLLITMGTLADRIGRKRLLLTGAFGFGAASALAAFATSPEMLIAARLLLGVAGATIMPSTLSLIRNIFPDPTERTRAIAIWSAAATCGVAIGPLIGGVLLEHFWWGSVFLINVPVMVLLVAAGWWLLPDSRDPAPGRYDLPSAALSLLAVVPVVFAVKHMVSHGVDLTAVLAAGFGLGAGAVFARRQVRLSAPMIELSLFANPAFSGAVVSQYLSVFALTGLLYFFSQYLQLARGFSPIQAGVGELPLTAAAIVVIVLVGPLSRLLGNGRAIGSGLALTAAGLVLVAGTESAESYLWLALALVPVGLGVGVAMTLTTDAVVGAAPPRKAGAASAIAETAYELGVATGIAVLGSILAVVYRHALEVPAGLGSRTADQVRDSLAGALEVVDPASAVAEAARHAFVDGMQAAALVAAVLMLLGAVVAWRTIPAAAAGEAVADPDTRER